MSARSNPEGRIAFSMNGKSSLAVLLLFAAFAAALSAAAAAAAEMAAEAEKKLPYPFCREGPCLCDVCEKYGCSDPWKVCYPSNTCPVLGI